MRIVAGRHRGRALVAPAGLATRPTSARAREATFSMLGPIGPVAVLDLFAGSGALGLEALSRGAERATFVDHDRAATAAIRANLRALGLTSAAQIRGVDWADALVAEARQGRLYGLCFIDPPHVHAADLATRLGPLLRPVLRPGAAVVMARPAGAPAVLDLPLAEVRHREHGRVGISLMRLAQAPGGRDGDP